MTLALLECVWPSLGGMPSKSDQPITQVVNVKQIKCDLVMQNILS